MQVARPLLAAALLGASSMLVACDDGPTRPDSDPGSEDWVDVVAGDSHACALASDGRVFCWGATSTGQAGQPSGPVTTPRPVDTEAAFVSLAAGGETTCGIDASGRMLCWGNNQLGQLGDGSGLNSFRPVEVSGGLRWSDVSVGTYHVCGVDLERTVRCWGGDRWDVALGYPAPRECAAPRFEATWPCSDGPFLGLDGWDRVEAGLYQTCAWRAGEASAACWGTNDLGQLGVATQRECLNSDPLHPTTKPCSPVPVAPDGPAMVRIRPGATHGCGLDATGALYCWGGTLLDFGQIGDGSLDGATRPVPVAKGGPWADVYTSHGANIRTFSCGLDPSGAAWCWGADRWGQLGAGGSQPCGEGSVPCRATPVAVAGGHSFSTLALGTEFACGLTTGGELLCWGQNAGGQLGDGTLDARATPVAVVF